ncbi:MAG: class I SAM-dependent methyltransferase family protein [Thermoplasmata archaeon]|nr:MAG: class I SAM-dependent methyltransferase family protein [Thermoplasmata archaeon]
MTLSWGVKVPKEDAERVHKILLKRKIIDISLRTLRDEKYVYFPVVAPIVIENTELVRMNFPKKNMLNPKDKIRHELLKRVPKEIVEIVPEYWEVIGDAVIIKLPEDAEKYKKAIGESFAIALGKKDVYLDKGVEGELRKPRFELIYGTGGPTIHKENKVLYKLDPARIMFSSGNIDERIRMSRLNITDEIIVDMFAGIGYFSLQIAVHCNPRLIYAIEKNPEAFEYLKENILLNNVNDTVIPILGDNRNVSPEGIADRVIMGYLHKTHKFLRRALEILKPEGGIIHYHDLVHNYGGIEEAKRRALNILENAGYRMSVLSSRYVKSYSPNVWHVVLDLKVEQE